MTQTTNLGLKKIDGGDNWRQIFDDHNQSMDLVDGAVAKLQEELGIVCNGNKCTVAASVGQYIILKNSSISGLEDGLYTASKAIPANTVIDSTYLAAVSNGGLNALNSNIIEHGRIVLTALTKTVAIGSATFYYQDITFTKTFTSAPHVVISTVNDATGGAGDIGGNYFASAVSKTGFKIYCKYKIGAYYFDWIAIADR